MERNDYVEKYLNAYKEMREAAIEKMKKYGKELDVYAEVDKIIMKEQGYKSVDEIYDEDRDDKYWELYNCVVEGRHETVFCCRIIKVRYDKKENDLDVYLEDDNGEACGWYPHWDVAFDKDAIYMTVHKYL